MELERTNLKIIIFIILFISNFVAYSGTINVGVLEFAPPFSSLSGDKNHYFGFTIDLMDEICKRLHSECAFKAATVGEQITLLNQGTIDVSFIPVPITTDQAGNFIFSLPYLASNGQFISVDGGGVSTLADLKNHNVGVLKDTLYSTLLKSPYVSVDKIKQYTVITDLIAALGNHEVDAIFVNDSVARFIINNAVHHLFLVGDKIHMGEGYAIMARKNNTDLIKQINQALLDMEQDGSYLRIYNRYFGY